MSLHLGEILGGPELLGKDFVQITLRICKRKDEWQGELIDPEDGKLNVVFRYPGSVSQPDFLGIRAGRFVTKERRLEIRVGVSVEILNSSDFALHFAALLKEAIVQGKKVFDKKGIPFSLDDHLTLVDKSLEG